MVIRRLAWGLAAMAVAGLGAGTPPASLPAPVSTVETPTAPAVVRPGVSALSVRDAAEVAPEDLTFTARAVIVFADTPAHAAFRSQVDLINRDPAGLAARDVVVLLDTDPANASSWRRKLRPVGFSLVILDKQGTVIDRKPFPWNSREIGRAIDKTPESRAENARARAGG